MDGKSYIIGRFSQSQQLIRRSDLRALKGEEDVEKDFSWLVFVTSKGSLLVVNSHQATKVPYLDPCPYRVATLLWTQSGLLGPGPETVQMHLRGPDACGL